MHWRREARALRGTTRKPREASLDDSAATAAEVPEMTACAGSFRLASHTSLPDGLMSQAPGPMTAAIASSLGAVAALAIAVARWHTRLKALSRSSAPAACSAAISPRLCPAAKSAWRPALFMMSKAPTETATVAGCACSVFCSRSSYLGSDSLS